jgi:hypothetical protein
MADHLPHGLPLRFSQVSVEASGDQSRGDILNPDLHTALTDLVTLGPVRRAVQRVTGAGKAGQGKLLVGGIEGVVNQVRFSLSSPPESAMRGSGGTRMP